MTEQMPTHPSERSRWAPWWLYVIVILGANYIRQMVMPVGTVPEWAVVVIVVMISAALLRRHHRHIQIREAPLSVGVDRCDNEWGVRG